MLQIAALILIITALYFLFRRKIKSKSWVKPTETFPADWREILTNHVHFYSLLSDEEKSWFEFKVQEFLLNCKITGIETNVETKDKIFVASSAVIPIFAFRNWKYSNIDEVLLYPSSFNQDFQTEGNYRMIAGMVGNGSMEGKMILSKPALEQGFQNETDKRNTAIHEFVHLIDKTDGATDGIPSLLLEKQYTIPWIDLITKNIDEIYKNKSDINPYGGTNRAEFLAVVSEYFFERPELLEKNHPELYALLEQIFNQDLAAKLEYKKKKNVG